MEIRCTAGLDDPRLALFCGLTDHELRRSVEAEHGIFIAESAKVVRSALAACVRPVAFLLEDRRLGQAAALIEAAGPDVPVFVLDREEISRIVGYPHNRGVLCAMERPAPRPADEVLAQAKTCAVVEAVTDTTNVGAIFRSAAALGCDAVLLTPTCADPLARRCVRVSMGSVFSVTARGPKRASSSFTVTGSPWWPAPFPPTPWSSDRPQPMLSNSRRSSSARRATAWRPPPWPLPIVWCASPWRTASTL